MTSRRRTLLLAVLACVLCAGVVPLTTAAPAQARTLTISPGADLRSAMQSLRAGDTLRLNPGTYDAGYIAPRLAQGTAAAPIVVTAADLTRKPLIRGGLHLTSAAHWHLDGLRVQATGAGHSALYVDGGGWWKVTRSEFWGARDTGSYANVVITGSGGGWPRAFDFSLNCVHHAAVTGRGNTDHNVYVNFKGAPGAGGSIARNIIASHPDGVGIKLGNGGAYDAVGPSGVSVRQNTIANGGRQVLLHGRVSNNVISGNLLGLSTEPFSADPRTTAVYVHDVTGTGNSWGNNYVFRSSMTSFDPGRDLRDLGDNGLRGDPSMQGGYCDWRPAAAAAAPYGRYGTARF